MTKIIIKDVFKKDWVTREAGEKLRKLIIKGLASGKVEVDFSSMKIASVSFFDEGLGKLKQEKLPPNWEKLLIVSNVNQWDREVLELVSQTRTIKIPMEDLPIKSHPWRICPVGEHYVHSHEKTTQAGKITKWKAFCRKNPSGKEIYTTEEIKEIATRFLGYELKYPSQSKHKEWNNYDILIAGWTQFWNETFMPTEELTPNLVKALIASESSFKVGAVALNRKSIGNAQGLVQLTEETVALLAHKSRELNDHFFELHKNDIYDPNINICVAIRWIFRKREIARLRLKRTPTWYEVMLEYKGILASNTDKAKKMRQSLDQKIREIEGKE